MGFRDWLLIEHGGMSGAGEFFYKLSLYPTDAFDGAEAFQDPRDVWALQGRWKIETKEGRPFYNLDKDAYLKQDFVTLQSRTLPEEGTWRHKSEGESNVEVKRVPSLQYLVHRRRDRDPIVAKKSTTSGYDVPLDKIFGDDVVTPRNVGPEFDRPWKEEYLPLNNIQDDRFTNTGMGVRSNFVGPDETGEKRGDADCKIADFGFPAMRRRRQRGVRFSRDGVRYRR